MATTTSNKVKFLLLKKVIDFSADTFKIRLMTTGFAYNKDTHEVWADVSASEQANGFGYTTGGITLAGVAVTEDDTNDRGNVAWNNVSWTASGGNIGPCPGAIVIDDTVAAPVVDPIIGYIDFGGEQTAFDGGVGTIANIAFRINEG